MTGITPKYIPPMPLGADTALRGVPAPPRFRDAGAEKPKFELPAASIPAPGEGSPSPEVGAAGEAADGVANRRPSPAAGEPGTREAGGGAGANPALAKLREATEQFEAYFVGYLLKSMRAAVDEDGGLFPVSQGQKVFRDMLDDETAKSIGKTRQMGLADMMYREMAPSLGGSAEERKT